MDSDQDDIAGDGGDAFDDQASIRQSWILKQLTAGLKLKRRDVMRQFSCSPKTAQRDLTSLKDDGQIEFVGAPRTGHYQLRVKLES